jgi:hypothetical protein
MSINKFPYLEISKSFRTINSRTTFQSISFHNYKALEEI